MILDVIDLRSSWWDVHLNKAHWGTEGMTRFVTGDDILRKELVEVRIVQLANRSNGKATLPTQKTRSIDSVLRNRRPNQDKGYSH